MSTVAMHLERRAWCRWGMVFRVERGASGAFGAVGRAARREPYVLLAAAWCERRDEAQGRLDAWAKRNGLNEVAK